LETFTNDTTGAPLAPLWLTALVTLPLAWVTLELIPL